MIHESASDDTMNVDLSRQRPAFDALCVTALRREMEERILGGAVQRVEARPNELSLEIYARHARRWLFCHVGDDATRVHLSMLKSEPSALAETPMLLLLRKHVRGGRIVKVTQPRLERLLHFEVTTRDKGELRTCGLIIETMGRRSNAILVDQNGLILDALRRTPPSRSPHRPVLPRLPYQAPPPQDRLDPADPDLEAKLAAAITSMAPESQLSDALSKLVAGFSPLASREAVFRTPGDVGALIAQLPDWSSLADAVRGLVESVESGEVEAYVAYYDDAPVAVTPYRPLFLEAQPGVRLEPHDTISEAIEKAFALTTQPARVSRSAAEVARKIRAAIELERRREGSLAREVPEDEEVEQLRLFGEAIFASLASIPQGAASLEFNGLSVPLDPPRSPVEVANQYFSEYRKRRDAAARVPALRQESAHRLEYLESLLAMAEGSDVQSVHRQIARELESFQGSATEPSRKRRVSQEPQPRRFQGPDGSMILVGTNGVMNDRLTFKIAAADDLWFHARGEPGAHVVLRTTSRPPNPAAVQIAANLAARYSRARASGSVPVDHTLVRNVRKIRGAPPGLVRYVNETTITGRPDDAPTKSGTD